MQFTGFHDWIEIFRGGKQRDSEGREYDGDALIDGAVAMFDASRHEPPAVVGHPKNNSPAFGWVNELKSAVKDGTKVLLARFRQVVPEFEEAVRKGLYKKRSAAFYPDGSLRHVGFLGAAPPAVKGLADLRFGDDDGAVVFEFSDLEEAREAQAKRAKKYGIAVKEGGHVTKPSEWEHVPDDQFLDPVNYRYPCPDAKQTRAAASYWGREKNQEQYSARERAIINDRLDKFREQYKIGNFNEGGGSMEKFREFIEFLKFWKTEGRELLGEPAPEGGKTFSEEDVKAREDAARKKAAEEAKKTTEAEFAEKARKAAKSRRGEEITAFCEQSLKEGKIAPSWMKLGLKEFMESLDAEEPVQFAEGDQGKASRYEWFKGFLEELPKVVEFKEVATRETGGAAFAEKEEVEAGLRMASYVNPPEAGK